MTQAAQAPGALMKRQQFVADGLQSLPTRDAVGPMRADEEEEEISAGMRTFDAAPRARLGHRRRFSRHIGRPRSRYARWFDFYCPLVLT